MQLILQIYCVQKHTPLQLSDMSTTKNKSMKLTISDSQIKKNIQVTKTKDYRRKV